MKHRVSRSVSNTVGPPESLVHPPPFPSKKILCPSRISATISLNAFIVGLLRSTKITHGLPVRPFRTQLQEELE